MPRMLARSSACSRPMPIYRVRGNNDFDPDVPLNAVVTPGGVRIYITHGHRERVGHAVERHCAAAGLRGALRACFFGHTHRMMLERENGVWVCNPGSISLRAAVRPAMHG